MTTGRIVTRPMIADIWWLVLVGIVGNIASAIVITRPVASALLTTGFVVVFLAVAAIVAFGAALLASPLYSILQLVRILGGVAVIVGVVSFVDAWRVRGAAAVAHPTKGT